MSLEEKKTLVRRYFQDVPHNPDVCEEIFASSFQFHAIHHATNPTIVCTPESEKAVCEQLGTIWEDRRVVLDELMAEGDRVMVRWTFHGTHRGEYYGVPPTHRQVTFSGINIFRVADGKIAEVWDLVDRLWMWQQLGVLPETAEFLPQVKKAVPDQVPGS